MGTWEMFASDSHLQPPSPWLPQPLQEPGEEVGQGQEVHFTDREGEGRWVGKLTL